MQSTIQNPNISIGESLDGTKHVSFITDEHSFDGKIKLHIVDNSFIIYSENGVLQLNNISNDAIKAVQKHNIFKIINILTDEIHTVEIA